jgi:membrane glycosyltransferase
MSGELLVDMTRIMDKHPAIGILQTAPRTFGSETLFGRIMQFASAFYGGPFMAGLNYMQMGDATFWGHNAIIRLQPFIDYCGLPELPGKEPFGGRILSHDFVEAALMRKAGYFVFLLPVSDGSWEEGPPTLIDTLKRDRRWCQGNMQHIWLLFAKGWKPLSRLNFLHGILSYVSSLLWFAFLILATVLAGVTPSDAGQPAKYSGAVLLVITIIMLFLPKILMVGKEMGHPNVEKDYGGRSRVLSACLFDTVYFSLLAPILMIFHSKFVVFTLMGRGVKWAAQRRKSDDSADWEESIQTFAGVTIFALIWMGIALWLNPMFFLWILPVLGGIALSIPFSIWSSGVRYPQLFKTREDIDPPVVLKELQENMAKAHVRSKPLTRLADHYGLLQAVLDPYVNALHVGLLRQRQRATPENKDYLNELRKKLLRDGPTSLNPREAKALMYDADNMLRLHYDLWASTSQELHPWWDLAIRQYNILTYEPTTPLYR